MYNFNLHPEYDDMSSDPNKSGDKKPIVNVNSLKCIYVVSVLSACNAEIFTYPLDLVKTRLQIQGETAGQLGKAPHRSMTQTAMGIIQEEGFFKLWRGTGAIFLRHSVYSGIRIVVYRDLKSRIMAMQEDKTKFSLLNSIMCAVLAGGIAQYIASPTDLIKVQIQMEGKRRLMGLPPRVKGIGDAFMQAYNKGGVVALWKGSLPNVGRAALVTVGDISGYDIAKRFLLKNTSMTDNSTTHVVASLFAGFLSAILGTPADVIKSRVMNQPFDEKGRGLLYKGPLDCLKKAIADEGALSLYKGFMPVWMRLGPWALFFWVSYERIMRTIGGDSF